MPICASKRCFQKYKLAGLIMKKLTLVTFVIMFVTGCAAAQGAKPWTEWTKNDAEKILNESAWGRTQEDTDTSKMNYSPGNNETIGRTTKGTTADKSSSEGPYTESGAKNQALFLRYRIRFISAKPVRQAFARMLMISQANNQAAKQIATKLQTAFVDLDYGDYIVIGVVPEATDRRQLGPADQALRGATVATLKNTCYIERKDGKRIFLVEYEPPTPDQTGAKFIFQRTLDGWPFMTEGDIVRFVAEVGDKVKLNMKYKVSDMMFGGKLEY